MLRKMFGPQALAIVWMQLFAQVLASFDAAIPEGTNFSEYKAFFLTWPLVKVSSF